MAAALSAASRSAVVGVKRWRRGWLASGQPEEEAVAALVVAGFHRSGTSLATEILSRAGLFIGDELIGANPSNPYGHFEDHEIVRFHDQMLGDAGQTWHVDTSFTPVVRPERWARMASIVDRRRARHRRWGFKDPRVCFYVGAWKYLVPELRVLVVYRDPRESAWSLERRHARDLHRRSGPAELHRLFWTRPDHALRMWVTHNRALIDFARAHREHTLVLPHAAIMRGLPLVQAVNDALDQRLDPVDNREVFDPTVTRARPHRQPVSSQRTIDLVLETWGELEMLAADDATRYAGGVHAH